MDDRNSSLSNGDIGDGSIESLYSSSDDDDDDETSHYLTPSLKDLEIVESIMVEMLEKKARSAETRAAGMAMDPMLQRAGDSSIGVLLEEVDNDEEIAQEDGSSESSESQNSAQKSSISDHSSPSSNNDEAESAEPVEPAVPAYPDPAALRRKELVYFASIFSREKDVEEKMKKKSRKRVKTSRDPETVAAIKRTEEVSESIMILQSLVPGGSKMDVTTLLDELINYLKFLEKHNKIAEGLMGKDVGSVGFPPTAHFYPFY